MPMTDGENARAKIIHTRSKTSIYMPYLMIENISYFTLDEVSICEVKFHTNILKSLTPSL